MARLRYFCEMFLFAFWKESATEFPVSLLSPNRETMPFGWAFGRHRSRGAMEQQRLNSGRPAPSLKTSKQLGNQVRAASLYRQRGANSSACSSTAQRSTRVILLDPGSLGRDRLPRPTKASILVLDPRCACETLYPTQSGCRFANC